MGGRLGNGGAAGFLELVTCYLNLRSVRCVQRPAFGLVAQTLQLDHDLAPKAVEFADRHHHRAVQLRDECAQFKRCAAEPAELLAQAFDRERMILCGRECDERFQLGDVAFVIRGDQRERRASVTMHLKVQWALETDFFAFEGLAHATIKRRIICFPEILAWLYATKINVAVAEAERRFGAALVD